MTLSLPERLARQQDGPFGRPFLLCRHPGKLLTHNWLLEHVLGPGYTGDVDVLRVFVSLARRKIEPDPARPKIIATDPGIAYGWLLRPADEGERVGN